MSAQAMAKVAQRTDIDETGIRPFRVNVPEAELTELRKRLAGYIGRR